MPTDFAFYVEHPRSRPYNPIAVCYEEVWEIVKDLFRAKSWRERFGYLWAPPD